MKLNKFLNEEIFAPRDIATATKEQRIDYLIENDIRRAKEEDDWDWMTELLTKEYKKYSHDQLVNYFKLNFGTK